jgi:hypothetical protein
MTASRFNRRSRRQRHDWPSNSLPQLMLQCNKYLIVRAVYVDRRVSRRPLRQLGIAIIDRGFAAAGKRPKPSSEAI